MPRVIHFEINADDTQRAAKFYRELFDWKISRWNESSDYWLTESGTREEPGIDGGIQQREQPSDSTVNVIGVDSIEEYLEKVPQLGGVVLTDIMPIPGVGWAAYCKDSEGNTFGLFQSDESAS
jgi:hypothetical protein